MSELAIRVENLAKMYRIGTADPMPQNGWEAARAMATSPFRYLQKMRRPPSEEETFWALRDVSFEVKRGEVVGIIGRNGAGKSTLLKILSRITEPTSGHAQIYGRVGSLLEVGTGFHPELTGRENIFLNGAILGMKRAEIQAKFDEIVAFAEIEQFLDTPVKRYSSGMYVRLAFAVAAHLEPEILLVDEVLAVGDAAFQKKALGKMGDVVHEGRTVLFVSHNMGAITQLCNRAFLFEDGFLRREGNSTAVVRDYLAVAFAPSDDSVYQVESHPVRSPEYRPIIKEITLHQDTRERASWFLPQLPFQVDLLLAPHAPILDPRVAIAIEDELGHRIMTAASYFQGPGLPTIDGVSRLRCTLPSLELVDGRYLLSASVGTKASGLLDSVDCAVWFDVVWDGTHSNGEASSHHYGHIVRSSCWDIVDSPD